MDVITLPVPQHGNRCHLVHDRGRGLVVDPPRDHALVEQVAAEAGVEIVAVADTHVHNDYVSGAPMLARRHGADYLVAAEESVSAPHVGVRGGDVLAIGSLRVEVIDSPGHTDHHQAFLAGTGHGPSALLSGGSLLHGTVGRTDLISPERTLGLARAQWATARALASLPPSTLLLPTHGFGSFCAGARTAAEVAGPVTLGHQLVTNPALTTSRENFVAGLIAGYGPVPTYYAHMRGLNRAAAGGLPPVPARPVTAAQVADAILSGQWVFDVRDRVRFAQGHLAGTVNLERSDQLATYVGWLVPWQDDIVLLADDPDDLDVAVRDLAAIGIEGVATHALADDTELPATYRLAHWEDLRALSRPPVLLDVRQVDEFDDGHLVGAVNIPLHELDLRLLDVPAGEVWVYCRSGFRAGAAASILQRAGRAVVHIDDEWTRVPEVPLPVSGALAA